MFAQSALVTPFTLGMTRRVTFMINRQLLGKKPEEAKQIADEVAFSVASTVASAAAVLTLDPIGGGLSAAYLALEIGEAGQPPVQVKGADRG